MITLEIFPFPAGNVTICEYEGKVHQVGQRFMSADCELRCRCMKNGATVCEPMECRPGFIRSGKTVKGVYEQCWRKYEVGVAG